MLLIASDCFLSPRCHSSTGVRALVFAPLGLESVDFALFVDFASLYQPKPTRHPARTPKQKQLYLKGLHASALWFGHAHTVAWLHSALPADSPTCGCLAACSCSPQRVPTFEQSGWCYVEARLSELLKPRINRLDLAKANLQKLKAYSEMVAKCVAAAEPEPAKPPAVAAALRFEKRFGSISAKTDPPLLTSLYAHFYRCAATAAFPNGRAHRPRPRATE